MTSYSYSNPQSYNGSPERSINRKVHERKIQGETDWAELVRYQQNVAAHMVQQEREKRLQQQNEFRQANTFLADEKQQLKTMELQNKYYEGAQVARSKEEYEQYLANAKNNKLNLQKGFAAEYDREKQDRDDTRRNMMENDQQIGKRIVNQALDSLDRERYLNAKRKNEFTQMTDQTLREAEAKKRREAELAQLNREEHNRLMDENSYNQAMKELNYKMYYQRISDKQAELQQSFDKRQGFEERSRENHLQDFVKKGVVDATRKAMEEEMRRQAQRDELHKSTFDTNRSKIEDHQYDKLRQKQEYEQSIEQRRQREYEVQEQNHLMKQFKANQIGAYQSSLSNQVRDTEEIKRKQHADMTEFEKRTLLQNYEDALIPGLRSSKFDQLIAPQLKTQEKFHTSSYIPMPQFTSTARESVDPYQRTTTNGYAESPSQQTNNFSMSPPQQPQANYGGNDYGFNNSNSRANLHNSNSGLYNPITNPVPNNFQNPYLVKDFQKGLYSPKNYLAVMADKNLVPSGQR